MKKKRTSQKTPRSRLHRIQSMTGFATIRGQTGGRRFMVEARSVNHRFCEVNVRLPGKYSAWELPIQKEVRSRFARGRIDIFIKEESGAGGPSVDVKQFRRAHQQLKRIARELSIPDALSMDTLLQFKQNYFREEDTINIDDLWKGFKPILEKLIVKLSAVRQKEGDNLWRWFVRCSPIMRRLLASIRSRVAKQPKQFRERLQKRFAEFNIALNQGDERLATEIALLCDKIDVTEEIVRLESHIETYEQMLKEGGQIGRKMDFLMQEVGREVNTIASKSQDSAISRQTVQFKTEIEKIREQAANVE